MKTNKNYKLSPSSLNLFEDCPKCFYFSIVKNIKRPSGIFPSLGSGMDRVLKEHFDRFMEKGELPPELREKKLAEGCYLFNDKEKLKTWRNYFKGIRYSDKESGTVLMGAIDNLLVKDGKLIVLDYKTRGYPLKKDTHTYYQTQMDLYNLLLRKNNYQTEDYAFLLFYYPNTINETGEFLFNTELVKLPTAPEKGEELFKNAIRILKSEKSLESIADCEFCKLRK